MIPCYLLNLLIFGIMQAGVLVAGKKCCSNECRYLSQSTCGYPFTEGLFGNAFGCKQRKKFGAFAAVGRENGIPWLKSRSSNHTFDSAAE